MRNPFRTKRWEYRSEGHQYLENTNIPSGGWELMSVHKVDDYIYESAAPDYTGRQVRQGNHLVLIWRREL